MAFFSLAAVREVEGFDLAGGFSFELLVCWRAPPLAVARFSSMSKSMTSASSSEAMLESLTSLSTSKNSAVESVAELESLLLDESDASFCSSEDSLSLYLALDDEEEDDEGFLCCCCF